MNVNADAHMHKYAGKSLKRIPEHSLHTNTYVGMKRGGGI